MRDIATTTLSGNLTRDVELRQLPSGADVARLRIATTTRRRNGEEWVDKTNYFTIEVFGAQARACAQYLSKGSRVLVDAEPDWREWTDQQNNKREAVTFKARAARRHLPGAGLWAATSRFRPRDDRYGQPSAVMDLGEAVQTAVERGLPLLLSTEAAGHLADSVRVGRMKGRPGALTITSSDGLSATTRRVVAEQAISQLRTLKQDGAKVTLDAGARQLVRMTLARPLADDPVLLGRQQHMAALKVVGSGVDASQVGTGKCCGPDTRVFANGALLRIEDLWERHAGSPWSDGEGYWATPRAPLVTNSLADDGRIVPSRVTALYRQRVRECGRRITLDDGSAITITNRHRLLGTDGWTSTLAAGDFVCVPQKLSWDGEQLPHELVELVACQLAEGHELSATKGTRRRDRAAITQKDTSVLTRLRRLAHLVGERYGIRMGTMPIRQQPGRPATLTIASTAYRRLLERELNYSWGHRRPRSGSRTRSWPPRI